MQKNTQKLLQHLPILLNLNPANLPVKTILALGKVKCWHFSPLFPQLSQKQWQELLFRKQIRLLCLVTLLSQVLAMSTFILHFVKGFGNHQNEKCEHTTHCLCIYYPQHQGRKWQIGENCARVVTNGQFLTRPYWIVHSSFPVKSEPLPYLLLWIILEHLGHEIIYNMSDLTGSDRYWSTVQRALQLAP